MQIGGYVADFRALSIDVSDDGQAWQPAWSGSAGMMALLAALKEPLTVPLRFPLNGVTGRYHPHASARTGPGVLLVDRGTAILGE